MQILTFRRSTAIAPAPHPMFPVCRRPSAQSTSSLSLQICSLSLLVLTGMRPFSDSTSAQLSPLSRPDPHSLPLSSIQTWTQHKFQLFVKMWHAKVYGYVRRNTNIVLLEVPLVSVC